nr:hypothetical protein [Tanacetum cinerariifolium]
MDKMFQLANLHGTLNLDIGQIPQVFLVNYYFKNLCCVDSDEEVTSMYRSHEKAKKDVSIIKGKVILDDFEDVANGKGKVVLDDFADVGNGKVKVVLDESKDGLPQNIESDKEVRPLGILSLGQLINVRCNRLYGSLHTTTVVVPAVPATDDSPAVPEHTIVKTPMNMSPKTKLIINQKGSDSFDIDWMVNVDGARKNVDSLVVQQSEIQCYNCKEFGHFAKECRKPKRVKDFAYHKEKMLLCKQAEKADSGTDSEPLEQVQNDTGYNVFSNELQHFKQSESIINTYVVETDDSNVIPDSPDMCDNDIQNDQNDVECEDERIVLANLIANLKLNVDENKKIQKQLKKANTSLAHELE